MKKLVIKFLCIAVPILLLIGCVNAYVDPAALFFRAREISTVVELLLEGNYIAGTENMNERHLQKQRIQSEESLPEIIIIGSSRVMQIDSTFIHQHVGEGEFVNHGVSGGGLYDYYGILGCYALYKGEWPKTIIIGADPWIFNGDNTEETRYDYYQNEITYMRALVSERKNAWGEKPKVLIMQAWDFTGQLFSPAYFQYALEWRQGMDAKQDISYRIVDGEDATEDALRRPDGSFRYPLNSIYRDPSDVEKEVANAIANNSIYHLTNYGEMNADMQKEFLLLVDFLQEQGVEVILYLPPFHPSYYEYFETNENYKAVLATEEWLFEYAGIRGIQVYGSYNPAYQDLAPTDFLDGIHLRNLPEKEAWKQNGSN